MELKVFNLGLIDYIKAYELQKDTYSKVRNNEYRSALFICRHNPVLTFGRSLNTNNLLVSESDLKNKQIRLISTERAGDITYHGPGQITAYPIFNLNYFKKDIRWFLESLEDTIKDFLAALGIEGERISGLTGIWIAKEKIASIGIAIRHWVSMHGLSINIKKNDLENFGLIKPCGMNISMTSVESILGRTIKIDDLGEELVNKFNKRFT